MKTTLCYKIKCGHEEVKTLKDKKHYKVMFQDCGAFHVKVFEYKTWNRLTWEVFDTFTEANKFFKSIK